MLLRGAVGVRRWSTPRTSCDARCGDFPIASSIVVPPSTELVFLSGTLADVVKPDAPAGSIERLGDTETQAASVLGKLARELAASGLTMADVVKMNVFLVGDPAKGGAMDFAGLMKAYSRVFGAGTQGKLPTRTTVQVVGASRSPGPWSKSRSWPPASASDAMHDMNGTQ